MADAAPDDEDKAWIKRALEVLESFPRRISALLLREASPGTKRVTTNARVRSQLDFIDVELGAILAPLRRHLALKELGADRIRELTGFIGRFLDRYERRPPCHAVLLHRAARCCRRTTYAEPVDLWEFECIKEDLTSLTQRPVMHKHLLLVSDDRDDTASTSTQTYRRLSYWSHQLYLYMASMFPQEYKFDKNRLIWKWAYEGLADADALSQAEVCFSELVRRKVIIQAAKYGHKPAAEAEDCRWQVNPDMLQFLASESADKGVFRTSSMLNSAAAASGDSDSTEILRWLSLHQPDRKVPTLLETMDLSHTRSLAVSGGVDRIHLGKFIYLRVLDLEGWENLKDEDLLQICSTMFLLRYLSVRSTGVIRLPPEIKKLRHLKELDASHTKISELPPEACKLEELRVLDLRSTQVRQLPEQIVELTNSLRRLLVGGDGINPDETVAKVPEGIVCRRDLRTLATVDLSEWSASSVEALCVQEDLEVLAITWSFHQCADGRYQEALRSSIEEWEKLRSLTIHCGLGCSMEFLGSLRRPPEGLEKFKVTTGRFASVPQWIEGLEYLSFLQITVCKLGADDLKILGELPKLQCLVLGLDFLPGEAIVIRSEGFSQLQTFSVHCIVPWLTFGEEAMPKLTYIDLEIICSVPPNQDIVLSGISNLEKLREVVLRYSDSSRVKKTVEAVQKAVAKHRGPINLFINGTQHYVQRQLMRRQRGRQQQRFRVKLKLKAKSKVKPRCRNKRRGKYASSLSYLQ